MHPDWGLIRHVSLNEHWTLSIEQREKVNLRYPDSLIKNLADIKKLKNVRFFLFSSFRERNFIPVANSVDMKFLDMKIDLEGGRRKIVATCMYEMLLPSLFSPVHFIIIIFCFQTLFRFLLCTFFLPGISLENISMDRWQRFLLSKESHKRPNVTSEQFPNESFFFSFTY